MNLQYRIKGNSMEPFLKNGSIVVLKEVNKVELGDIVVYSTINNYKIFHRIVDMNKNTILCKGDNCLHFDRIAYDFGDKYIVLRHPLKKEFAKVSKFCGICYAKIYKKNPMKYQNKGFTVAAMQLLQKMLMHALYKVYCIIK